MSVRFVANIEPKQIDSFVRVTCIRKGKIPSLSGHTRRSRGRETHDGAVNKVPKIKNKPKIFKPTEF